jgi:hypothetical protein
MRSRQSPFSVGILRPNNGRFEKRDFLDNQTLRKERKNSYVQMKTFRFKKVSPGSAGRLRNVDSGQCQAAPRRNTDTPDTKRGAQAMAEFLLDPGLCPLRLHIQINDQERDCGDAE